MARLTKCEFGGGPSCKRQGGTGSNYHAAWYSHPVPHGSDLAAVGTIVKSAPSVVFDAALEQDFDDDLAKSALMTEFGKAFNERDLVRKSLYDIDLDSPDGIAKVLSLMPILDPEIVRGIYAEIFVNYDTKDLPIRIARIEIKAYLMDKLELLGVPEDEPTQEAAYE